MSAEPGTTFPPRYRLTVADFDRLVTAGILEEDARVELMEGDLIDMAPIGSLHAGMVARLGRILTLATVSQALVYTQSPIVCGEHSEPQPDIALLRPRADDYTEALPVPSDVLLLIEVADRSLRYDREIKVPLYARHRIPEVWLLDLPQRRIEVYREPGIDGYRHLLRPDPGDNLLLSSLPDLSLRVAALWP